MNVLDHTTQVPEGMETSKQLAEYIDTLIGHPHDYNTCVYAMSLAAYAAYQFVAYKLGVTGFQASCADLDFLRKTRHMEVFHILDISKLLYPQYCDSESFPDVNQLLDKHKEWLAEKAKEFLEQHKDVHPNVKAHWEKLSKGGIF